jgi:hypothetical protein
MYTYELVATPWSYFIQRSDGASIPADFGNRDFQVFIRWLQAGNELPGLPDVM